MSDELNRHTARERTRIDLSEQDDIAYWTFALAVPEDELRRLVAEVGDNVETVRQALAEKSPPSVLIER